MEQHHIRIAVLGGGNSALTMAADLALNGATVSLFDFPEFASRTDAIRQTRRIEKYGSSSTKGVTGTAELARVTTDLKEAIGDAELIVVAVPAYAHMRFFEAMAEILSAGQTVLISPGSWGAMCLYNLLRHKGRAAGIKIAETDICTHICRAGESFLGPDKVRVILERARIRVAAIPAADTEAVLALLRPFYPQMVGGTSVIETSLRNDNIVGHGPLMLMNAGWLEHTAGQFMIYRDGLTPSVARVIDAVRAERERVIGALGFPTVALPAPGETHARYSTAPWVHDPCEIAPPDLKHRYLSEDIPFGLVPLRHLGRALDIAMPAVDAVISLSGIVNEVDYGSSGLSLDTLGLAQMPIDQMLKFAESGAVPSA